MNLGMSELLIILVIVLVVFGPSKLPSLGKALGETVRGFKKGMSETTEKSAELPHENRAGSDTAKKQAEKSQRNS